jgi:thioredoxin 1
VDSNGGVAMRYRITSIPTLLLFKEGRVADTVVGPRGKPDIVKMIERHVQ